MGPILNYPRVSASVGSRFSRRAGSTDAGFKHLAIGFSRGGTGAEFVSEATTAAGMSLGQHQTSWGENYCLCEIPFGSVDCRAALLDHDSLPGHRINKIVDVKVDTKFQDLDRSCQTANRQNSFREQAREEKWLM